MRVVLQNARDIPVKHRFLAMLPGARRARRIGRSSRYRSQILDIVAVKRLRSPHHFEPVIFRGVMRSGNHNTTGGIQNIDGEIKHWGGTKPDPDRIDTTIVQPVNHRLFHLRGTETSVISDADGLPAILHDHGPEGASDRIGIVRRQGVVDHTANIVFAQDRRIEAVGVAAAHDRFAARTGSRPTL